MMEMPQTTTEKWIIGEPGGPAGPFYSVVSEHGRVIAMQVLTKDHAMLITQIPQLVHLRYEWAIIINHLAHIALDGPDSNDRDYCEDMIEMVRPYLPGAIRRASLILTLPTAVAAGWLTGSSGTGFWAGLGCLASVVVNPDLDQEGISAAEWRLVRCTGPFGHLWMAYWWLYAWAIPHRSPWSHLPGFGTAVRLLYAIPLIVGAVMLASAIARKFDPSAFSVSDIVWSTRFWRVMLGVFVGLCVSDAAHFVMDVV